MQPTDSMKNIIVKGVKDIIEFSAKNPTFVYGSLSSIIVLTSFALSKRLLKYSRNIDGYMIKDHDMNPPRTIHNHRRQLTYPNTTLNAWYHFCDSDELDIGEVKEIQALGRVFVLWRTIDGKPVCQDAYCIHLGANLAVGGEIVDNCIECPFHKWKFASDGTVNNIPYHTDKNHTCNIQKKLRTYDCIDYCGMIMVYFHTEDKSPEFSLPEYLSNELKNEGWMRYFKWDAGYHPHNIIDWCDQAGDYSHFNTLHASFVIPWTTIPLPKFIQYLFPIGINHIVTTHRGDDQDWIDRVNTTNQYWIGKQFIFFTDKASLTWNNQVLTASSSETMEIYLGPSTIVMNVPFTIGAFKIFFTMLPVENGVILRARTWIDRRTQFNPFIRFISWILQGISASQLWSDILILDHKIRLLKPIIQYGDGPWSRINAWIKQFISDNSYITPSSGYKNDW